MLIRSAQAADIGYVHHLIEELEDQIIPIASFQRCYLANLEDPDLIYLVVEIDAWVAAFGSLAIHHPLHHAAAVAEIVELVVDMRCRSQNIGAALLRQLLKEAHSRGCCCVDVDSNRSRERAHHFYEKNGFAQTHVKLTMDLDQLTDL